MPPTWGGGTLGNAYCKLCNSHSPKYTFSVNWHTEVVCLFDLILYVPSTIFQLKRDGSSWVEPVLS